MNPIASSLLLPGIPILEKIVRPIIVYLFLVIALRLAGKREMAQLNAFDLVVLLTLSNTVQNAIIGNDNSVSGGIIGATTLLFVNAIVVHLLYRFRRADRLLEGEATELVKDGQFIAENMRHEVVTENELLSVIRRQGIDNLADVKSVTLETNGNICVLAKHPTSEENISSAILERLERIESRLPPFPAATPK